jgi:hypothetical protein
MRITPHTRGDRLFDSLSGPLFDLLFDLLFAPGFNRTIVFTRMPE